MLLKSHFTYAIIYRVIKLIIIYAPERILRHGIDSLLKPRNSKDKDLTPGDTSRRRQKKLGSNVSAAARNVPEKHQACMDHGTKTESNLSGCDHGAVAGPSG